LSVPLGDPFGRSLSVEVTELGRGGVDAGRSTGSFGSGVIPGCAGGGTTGLGDTPAVPETPGRSVEEEVEVAPLGAFKLLDGSPGNKDFRGSAPDSEVGFG
jgi:hypothetical protein